MAGNSYKPYGTIVPVGISFRLATIVAFSIPNWVGLLAAVVFALNVSSTLSISKDRCIL